MPTKRSDSSNLAELVPHKASPKKITKKIIKQKQTKCLLTVKIKFVIRSTLLHNIYLSACTGISVEKRNHGTPLIAKMHYYNILELLKRQAPTGINTHTYIYIYIYVYVYIY